MLTGSRHDPVARVTASTPRWVVASHRTAVQALVVAARVVVMNRFAALALVGVAACAAPGKTPDNLKEPAALAAFAQEFVDAHNAVRARATPAPSPALGDVAWSDSAAALATDWANRCVFDHRNPNDLGENLAVFSPQEVTPKDVVELWAEEAAAYDYDANDCRAGQCGHYTQIVWRDSVGVGCAVAECDDVSGFGPGTLWVCNYDPPGNFIGQRPY